MILAKMPMVSNVAGGGAGRSVLAVALMLTVGAARADVVDVVGADSRYESGEDGASAGSSLAAVDGFFGAGRSALVIGAYLADPLGSQEAGTAFVFDANVTTGVFPMNLADYQVYGSETEGSMAFGLSGRGDVNDDGIPDLAIGGWSVDGGGLFDAGQVRIFFGDETRSGTDMVSDADLTIDGQDVEDHLGWAVDISGDFNDDGIEDIVVGAPLGQTPVVSSGEVFVFFGSASLTSGLTLDPADADVHIRGTQVASGFGQSIAMGDINGDFIDDLLVGAPGQDTAGRFNNGTVYGFLGAASWGPSDVIDGPNDFDFALLGATSNDGFGHSVIVLPDMDDDGDGDIVVGAPYNDEDGGYAGRVYVFGGGEVTMPVVLDALTDAASILTGDSAGDFAGFAVGYAGDFDGDTIADLLVGAPGDDPAGRSGAGSAYLVLGQNGALPPSGTLTSVATRQYIGSDAGDELGTAVGSVRDLTLDSSFDLVLGAPGRDVDAEITNAGAVYLYAGAEIVSVPSGGEPVIVGAPFPNPLSGSVVVPIAPGVSITRAIVTDVRGRRVRVLDVASVSGGDGGPHALRWDGRDARGHRVANGPYFLRVDGEDGHQVTRLDVIR